MDILVQKRSDVCALLVTQLIAMVEKHNTFIIINCANNYRGRDSGRRGNFRKSTETPDGPAGGPSLIKAEHLNSWLPEATREKDPYT